MLRFLLLILFYGSGLFATEKPNVIFILADDLGYHELGSYGQQKIKTPYLDTLRAGDEVYRHLFGECGLCAIALYFTDWFSPWSCMDSK